MRRVLIADDHQVVLIGIDSLLTKAGLRVVGQAADPIQLEALLASRRCELLITDLSMPSIVRPDGVRMLEGIRRSYKDLPVLVFTAFGNPELLRAVINVGVQGVVEKCGGLDELLGAVQSILRGEPYISRRLSQCLDEEQSRGSLSAREVEVVRLLAHGLSAKQIADVHHRTLSTISRQKGAAMTRLGLRSDYELFQYARRAGLAPGGS